MPQIESLVTTKDIDLAKISMWAPASQHGAINMFVGVVRNKNLNKDVVSVEYECFTPLCEKIFTEIATEACNKWEPSANILIVHRQGRLNVGEVSVAIVATTGHRDESYRITRYIIEEIKIRAPIWKKEFYLNGHTDWVPGHALCQHNKVNHYENTGYSTCGR